MSQEQKPQTVAESIINAKDDGTVPKDLKELIAQLFECVPDIVGFGQGVIQKMYMTEVYLHKKENEPRKWEAKTICEIVVTEDMTNLGGIMHGGCSSFIIDNATSAALSLLAAHMGKSPILVSQSLNVLFHAPATVGNKLKIISQTIHSSSRILSARCEIYDVTNGRLVASGVHTKMEPQQTPAGLL